MTLQIFLVFCFLVTTNAQQEGDVRLIGGTTATEGRVEVYYSDQWGTVCDDNWDLDDGHVVCRSLGLGDALEVFSNAAFGEGDGPIWLDDLGCTGSDTSILMCANAGGVGVHNCFHREDAGVRCSSNGVRLVDGESGFEGRVEVFYQDAWGTVCDDYWEDVEAQVVCGSLGFPGGTAVGNAGFGEGSDPIILDNVECEGDESSLFDCPSNDPLVHNCVHSEDAGVRCDPNTRLVDGSNTREGRVEVYYQGQWGTVCDDSWDDDDAGVVCQSLNFSPDGTARTQAHFGEGTGSIILDDVACTGDEDNIFACPNNGPLQHNCGHNEDAGVECSQIVRLVDGSSEGEGRVEVYYNGQWGTVCDDFWEDVDAGVVCRILGLGETGTAVSQAAFGEGSGEIVLDNVECTGSETDLFSCPGNEPLDHNCQHSEDAGVVCDRIRLVGGSSDDEGRVEVYYDGAWGTVCDDFWEDVDAGVVCQILGLGTSGTAIGSAAFGEGSGEIVLDNVECTGSETDLFCCPNNGPLEHNCQHSEDAGVTCS